MWEKSEEQEQRLKLLRMMFEEEEDGDEAFSEAGRISPRAETDELQLSFAQQRLWWLDQLLPSNASYNITSSLRLSGSLNVARLEQSLKEIVRRHEALRTRFELIDGRAVQVIDREVNWKLSTHDLSALAEDVREQRMLEMAAEEARTPFDLSAGTLFRASLLKLAKDNNVLLLMMHHIISDAWSLSVLVKELVTLYEAYTAGKSSPLPELGIQYADFALWQRRWLQGEVLEKQLAYWKQQLGDRPPALQLHTDYPRPAVQTYRGSMQTVTFPATLLSGLKSLSLGAGTTIFTTLLAAFNTLLHRYTGQPDILVGTPIANRNRAEIEPLIGFFVNTLVMRTDLRGDPTFRELLARVHDVTFGAYEHQDVPFEKLVQELQPERDTSRQPLFQVMFTLQNAGMPEVKIAGLEITLVNIPAETSKFDFTFIATEIDDRIRFEMEYSTDLFEAATIERMLGHYCRLLEGIVRDADRRLSQYDLMTAPEREQLLTASRGEGHDYPVEHCLHELFEQRAASTPEAVAIVFDEKEAVGYGELNARANQLAHHLRAAGVGAGSPVGLYVERSPEMVVGLLGILKAGGAYVPVDTQYPAERREYMLRDAGARVVVTTEELAAGLTGAIEVVRLDADAALIAQQSRHNPIGTTQPANIAYVIYTSGSTGQPKGVQVSHANVARLFSSTARRFHFDASDVWTLFHSYAFDFSVWEIWGALLHGAKLVVVPYLTSRTPQAFAELLRRERVTVLNQTPSAFRQLIQTDEMLSRMNETSLRLVIFGGEALELESLRAYFERCGDGRPQLVNMYGITETTVHTTCRPLSLADVRAGRGSLIGKPLPDLQIFLLDDNLQPVPVGVAGEMHVGGAGLADGYLNRPALTAERFIPHSYGEQPGARLYRTGDVARYLADGDLQYLGRADHQVKIRGFRIELGEVESALNEHAGVREAVVSVRDEGAGDKRLAAYVVFKQKPAPDIAELRRFLKEKLPEYMMPAVFVELDALPLTTNGKIDRRALPVPDDARPELGRDYIAPRTHAEQVLAAIWAEVLGVERVGTHDNFFELGGDSIRSIQVISRAKKEGLGYSLQQLFQHQTIHELLLNAISVKAATTQDGAHRVDGVTEQPRRPFGLITGQDRRRLPPDVEDAYPLTMLQAGMLFHSEFDSGSNTYYNVTSFHLRARYHLPAFEMAVRRLLRRHPVLRTSFETARYSQPLQLVHRAVAVPLEVEDIRALTHEEQEHALERWMATETQRPFDLTEAPLLRFHIHRRSEETFQLAISEHHAILDGWSVAVMLTELFHGYVSLLNGAEPDESPAATTTATGSFRDFVALERAALDAPESRQYWTQLLADASLARLPRQLPARTSLEGKAQIATVDVAISPEVSEGLRQLARAEGVPLKSVLLAAHLRLISFLSGQRDVVSGMLSHGRAAEGEGELVLGLFLNTLPVRLKIDEGRWTDLVRATFEAERELLPHRYYPMAQMQIERGGQPLFETAFNFTNFHIYQSLEGIDDVTVLKQTGFGETNFPFWADFSLDRTNSRVALALKCDRLQLSDPQMHAITGYYSRALSLMATEPSARHTSQSFLAADEHRQLFSEWNGARIEPAKHRLDELFEAQVERTPEHCAVMFHGQELTYRELDARANLLAHYLRQQGVGAEVAVGILLERSVEMVVALLGVLKAGGAYVPLDRASPPERLEFMMEEAGIAVVLTQESLRHRITRRGMPTVCLDADWQEIAASTTDETAKPVPTLAREAATNNLAYVIFTSGSTGRPKGVAIEHRSAATLVEWARAVFTPEDLEGVLASTALTFDLSVFEIFVALGAGGTVIIAENVLDLPTLTAAASVPRRVTLINTVPSAMTELLRSNAIPASVRTINLAGEPLQNSLAQQLYEKSNVRRVFNLYGPSEDTTYSTFALVTRGSTDAPPIGRPVANTRVYILDEWMQPVPVGVAGELYISGEGLARGYLHCPDLTAARFVPDPFAVVGGARMYRTGDFARRLSDGALDFLGRLDYQVKIRGFRIELGEIEAALGGYAGVLEALVMVREYKPGDRRLVAYLVMDGGARPGVIELREFLKQRLPEYMLPSAYVMLDALPLTAHGKINRAALPAPDNTRPEMKRPYEAARTPLEEEMVKIWSDVLGVERVGIHDGFFELGGHSLLALRLMSQIKNKFGHELPPSALFRGADVASLSAQLGAQSVTWRETALIEIQPEGTKLPFVCVHPVGGSIFCYRELAHALGTDQPFYALQAPRLNGAQLPSTIEHMAALYVEEVLRAQPRGAYRLGGWSFGGIVAYEMAQQLSAQGHAVSLLVMIDSYSPLHESQARMDVENEGSLLTRLILDLAGMRRQTLPLFPEELRQLQDEFSRLELTTEERLGYVLEQAVKLGILSSNMGGEYFERLFNVFKNNLRAARNYVPRPYAGRTLLFHARDAADLLADHLLADTSLGWKDFIGDSLEIRPSPGNHYTMLNAPHVQILTGALKPYLDKDAAQE